MDSKDLIHKGKPLIDTKTKEIALPGSLGERKD